MVLAGEEKEMRMPGSLGYHSLDQNTDQGGNHLQSSTVDHEKSTGGGVGATPAPYNSTTGGGGGSNKFNKVISRGARYRECLKNHAANIGGNVTDGCGEFMPSGQEGTLEAMKCAACNCHRNFHRKEQPHNVGSGDNNNAGIMVVHPLQLPQPLPSPIPSLNHHHQHSGRSIWATMPPQPVKMAFGGSGGGSGATDSSSEELNFNTYHHQQATSVPPQPQQPPFVLAKKRFRTKFSQEQKGKMLEFAEKLGWRIPREDDTEVQRFCSQVGVKRQVFKVWMHNNKNPSAKKNTLQDQDQHP
ncbi:unnamed protein product [Withania somnifera]